MATNDKRQLRLTISGILENYGISNLELELKLTDAVYTFDEETKKGSDPVKTRIGILDAMVSNLGAQRQYELMVERISKALLVTPDGGDVWNEVIKWLQKRDNEGETIERYAAWCKANPFTSPKAHQIAQKPGLIKATWPGAFVAAKNETIPDFVPPAPTGEYIPNPRRVQL